MPAQDTLSTVIDVAKSVKQMVRNEAAVEIEHLRDALSDIARQRLSVEMSDEAIEDADFQGAYDRMIEIARKALQPIT